MALRPDQSCDRLARLADLLVGVCPTTGDSLGNAMLQVLVQQPQRDRLQPSRRRRDLRQDVDAVLVLVDHPSQSPDLPLDARQTPKVDLSAHPDLPSPPTSLAGYSLPVPGCSPKGIQRCCAPPGYDLVIHMPFSSRTPTPAGINAPQALPAATPRWRPHRQSHRTLESMGVAVALASCAPPALCEPVDAHEVVHCLTAPTCDRAPPGAPTTAECAHGCPPSGVTPTPSTIIIQQSVDLRKS